MSPSKLTPDVWPITDVGGADNGENEDYVLIYQPQDPDEMLLSGSLYLVADGMGGGSRGRIASQYAAERIMQLYYQVVGEPDLGIRMRDAIEVTNRELYDYAKERPELVKLSTTVVAVVVRGEQLYAASVGDSRAYLIREGKIQQLTTDHTLVQQLLDENAISATQAREHPRRDVVLRSLGTEDTVTVDLYDQRLRADDVLLLCSDGLSHYMHDDEIAEIASTLSPRNAADTLLMKTKDRGSKDNVSIIPVLLRDGAPPLAADVPHMWDGTPPKLDGMANAALASGAAPAQQIRPSVGDETMMNQRPMNDSLQAGDTLVSSSGDWMDAPDTGQFATFQPPETPDYQQQETPAPTYDSSVKPAPQFGGEQEPPVDLGQTQQNPRMVPPQALQDHPSQWDEQQQLGQQAPLPQGPSQPQQVPPSPYIPQTPPPQSTPPGAMPPMQGQPPQASQYDQYGQRGVPRGYTPPPGSNVPIDPVTGLPAVPPGQGYVDPYAPRVYQPPSAAAQAGRNRGGISLAAFAGIGLVAILLTAILVVLLVNPFDFDLPFGSGGEEDVADIAPDETNAIVDPTAGGADGAAPVDPAAGNGPTDPAAQPALQPTTDPAAFVPTPTVPAPVQQAPPGMLFIDAGPFQRGVTEEEANNAIRQCINEDTSSGDVLCFPEYFGDAAPVEEVTLSSFFMDEFEVTNAQYAECVSAGVCSTPAVPEDGVSPFNDPNFAQHPVTFVNWSQANQYCTFAGKRLPTEAEWEKAARWNQSTGESLVWPWGNTFEDGRANTFSAGQGGTTAVQAFEGDVSPYGIRGMAGNVSEWVFDYYLDSYETLGTLNPRGPEAQPLDQPIRVARGGSFLDIASYARAGHRLTPPEQTQREWLGFRCVVGVEGAAPPAAPTPVPTEEVVEPADDAAPAEDGAGAQGDTADPDAGTDATTEDGTGTQ